MLRVLVDFWADWCGPCKMLGPVLEQVAAKVDDVQIVKINVDEESSVAEKYNIMSMYSLRKMYFFLYTVYNLSQNKNCHAL